MKTLIIYHRDADGFGAAYAAWKVYGPHTAKYYSWQYGEPPNLELFRGQSIYILDFSFSREELESINEVAYSLVVLDHHASAKTALEGLPYCKFSNRAGAIMAWPHFLPTSTIPPLLAYVEDRDLWKFELPNSREVTYGLGSYPFDFQVWDKLVQGGDTQTEQLAKDGAAIMRHIDMNVDRLIATNKRDIKIDGHLVKAVNCPLYQSEIAGKLAEMGTFGAVYYDLGEKRIYSLRSRSDFDVSEVAVKYGGGGHKAASGFNVPI